MTLSLPFATQDNQYSFSYLRMGQKSYNVPGIVLSGDMTVSAGSGLQCSIAAGEAYVQQTVARLGAFYASRGLYRIFSDSTASPYNAITAPVTYPRVDQVIARVYDAYEQQFSGNSYWRYEWLMGTETSGADLTNLDGAAALPDNSLRLAYSLGTVGMSSLTDIENVATSQDSGWINITGFYTNVSAGSSQPRARQIGNIVYLDGLLGVVSPGIPAGDGICRIPVGSLTADIYDLPLQLVNTNAASTLWNVSLTTVSEMINQNTATLGASDALISLQGMHYLVN